MEIFFGSTDTLILNSSLLECNYLYDSYLYKDFIIPKKEPSFFQNNIIYNTINHTLLPPLIDVRDSFYDFYGLFDNYVDYYPTREFINNRAIIYNSDAYTWFSAFDFFCIYSEFLFNLRELLGGCLYGYAEFFYTSFPFNIDNIYSTTFYVYMQIYMFYLWSLLLHILNFFEISLFFNYFYLNYVFSLGYFAIVYSFFSMIFFFYIFASYLLKRSILLRYIIKDIYSFFKAIFDLILFKWSKSLLAFFLFIVSNFGFSLFIFIFRLCHLFLILLWQTIFFSHFTWLRWDYYLHYYPRFISIWHVYYFKSAKPNDWKDSRRLSHYFLCRYYLIYMFKYIYGHIYYYFLVFKQAFLLFLLYIYGDAVYTLIVFFYLTIALIKKKSNYLIYNIFWQIVVFIRREAFFFTQTDFWHRNASVLRKLYYYEVIEYNEDHHWGNYLPRYGKSLLNFFSLLKPFNSEHVYSTFNSPKIKSYFSSPIHIFTSIFLWLNYNWFNLYFYFINKITSSLDYKIIVFKQVVFLKSKILKFFLFFDFYSLTKLFKSVVSLIFDIIIIIISNINYSLKKMVNILINIYIYLRRIVLFFLEIFLCFIFGAIYTSFFLFVVCYKIIIKSLISLFFFVIKRRLTLLCLFIIIFFGWPEFWLFFYFVTKWFGSAVYIALIHFYETFIDDWVMYEVGNAFIYDLVYFLQLMNVHETRLFLWSVEMYLYTPLQKLARFLYDPGFYLRMQWEYNYFKRANRFNRVYFGHWLAFINLPGYFRICSYLLLKALYARWLAFYEWYIYVYLPGMLTERFYYSLVESLNSTIYFYYYYLDIFIVYLFNKFVNFLDWIDSYIDLYNCYYFILNSVFYNYLIFYWNLFLMEDDNFISAIIWEFFAWVEFIALGENYKKFIWNFYSNSASYLNLSSYISIELSMDNSFALYLAITLEKLTNIIFYIKRDICLNLYSVKFLYSFADIDLSGYIFTLWYYLKSSLDSYLHFYEFKPKSVFYDVIPVENVAYEQNYWYWYFNEYTSNRLYNIIDFNPDGWKFLDMYLKDQYRIKAFTSVDYLIDNARGDKVSPFELYWDNKRTPLPSYVSVGDDDYELYSENYMINPPIWEFWAREMISKNATTRKMYVEYLNLHVGASNHHFDDDNWSFLNLRFLTHIYIHTWYNLILWFFGLAFIYLFFPSCTILNGSAFLDSTHSSEYYWRLFKVKSKLSDNLWLYDFALRTEREILHKSGEGKKITFDYFLYTFVKNGTIKLKNVCPIFRLNSDFDRDRKRLIYDFSVMRGYYFLYDGYEWFHQTMVKEFDTFNLFIAYAYNKNIYIKKMMQEYDPDYHETMDPLVYGGSLGILFEKKFWNKIFDYYMFLDSEIFNYKMPYWSYHKDQSLVCTTLYTLDDKVSVRENHDRRVFFEVETDDEVCYYLRTFWTIAAPMFLITILSEVVGLTTTSAFEEFKMVCFNIILSEFSLLDYYIFALMRAYIFVSFFSGSLKEYTGDGSEMVGAKVLLKQKMYVYWRFIMDDIEARYSGLRLFTLFWIGGDMHTFFLESSNFSNIKVYNELHIFHFLVYNFMKYVVIFSLFYSIFSRLLIFSNKKDPIFMKVKRFRPYLFQLDSFRSIYKFFGLNNFNKKTLLKSGVNYKTKI